MCTEPIDRDWSDAKETEHLDPAVRERRKPLTCEPSAASLGFPVGKGVG